MRIGLDIDNVITDFDKTVFKEFLKEDKNKRNKGVVNPNSDRLRRCFDWSDDEVEEFYAKKMEEMAKILEPRPNAKYYMDKLLEDGHELYLVSHRVYPHYKNPIETTIDWLKENDINYTKLILSKTSNKSIECKENDIEIMFDDFKINCHMLNESGIKAYLMATNYNIKNSTDGLEVVNDWQELYEVVSKIKKEKFF